MTLVWHDWFATSNDGVGSQKLDARTRTSSCARHALGSFDDAARRRHEGPGHAPLAERQREHQVDPNENYARELMELFTLGAGRGYTEDDVREQARALPAGGTTGTRAPATSTSATTRTATTPASRRSSARAATSAGTTPAGSASRHPLHAVVLRPQALELLHPDAAARATAARRSTALYRARGYQIAPGRRGDPQAPAPLHGPRMVKPPVVQVAGMHRALRRRIDTDPGSGSPSWTASASSTRRTSPAGTTPLARHLHAPRALDRRELRARPVRARHRHERQARRSTPRQARRPRARLLGEPDRDRADAHGAARVRAARARRRERGLEAGRLPGPDLKRAADARRRPPGLPDLYELLLQRVLPRARSCAAPSPRPGAACRRSSRACRFRLAAGSTAAASCCAPPGSRSPSTAPEARRSALFEEGIAAPRPARRARSSSRCSSRAAPTRSPCSSRPGDSSTRRSGRSSRSRRARARRSPRTRASAGTRRSRRSPTLHGEGKVTVLPAVGYTNADQSHFTSRHYWEVGATERNLRTGWLGRYLDLAGTMDNPLQGLALADSLQPALASRRCRSRPSRRSTTTTSGPRGVWGAVETRMLDALGHVRAAGSATRRDAGGRRDEAGRPPARPAPAVEDGTRAPRCPTRRRRSPSRRLAASRR